MMAVDGSFDSGITATIDVLDTANMLREHLDSPPPPWEIAVLGLDRSVRTAGGFYLVTCRYVDLDAPPDVLVAPALGLRHAGSIVETVSDPDQGRVLDLIDECRDDGAELAAACSGVFFVAETGALDGANATTSWWLAAAFRDRYRGVALDTEQTLVRSSGVTTAGAAFAHIDLALSLVHAQSPPLAELVARHLLIGDRSSQGAFAVPTMLAGHGPEIAAFERWVRSNLDGPIRISAAAAAIGLSERTLQRITASAVGMSPVEFVNEIRLEEASFLLRSSMLSAEVVAARVGFRNSSALRALLRRRRGVSIRELRRGAT